MARVLTLGWRRPCSMACSVSVEIPASLASPLLWSCPLTYTAHDEETGDEVERVEALPCRRCAEEASR